MHAHTDICVFSQTGTHITYNTLATTHGIDLIFSEWRRSFELVPFVTIMVEDRTRSNLREGGFILDQTEQT